MIRRLILAVLLLSASYAAANTYNDVFFDVAEPGWGVFVKQSNTFQFLAFYIYGPTGQPTWYTAQLTNNGDGTGLNYSGPLFATTGT
jgi:predicted small secreted protein